MTNVISLLVGAVAAFTGRKVLWLLVGLMGFVAALSFLREVPLLAGTGDPLKMAAAVVVGLIFMGLAQSIVGLAVNAMGFLAGFTIGSSLIAPLLNQTAFLPIIGIGIVAGLIGIGLAKLSFEWGVILLSAFAGATMMMDALSRMTTVSAAAQTVGAFVLAVFGITFQAGVLKLNSKK